MKLLSWNINGLRAVHKKGFLDWFNAEKADIVCVQETKLQEAQIPQELKYIRGYHSYFSHAEKKGYSGTAIWTKKEPDNVELSFGAGKFDTEGRHIRADFGDLCLFNVYFPNGKASPERLEYKMSYYKSILAHLIKLVKKGKKVIVCGDVNTAHTEIDLARPRENSASSGFLPQERRWIDSLISEGFIDTFRIFNGDGGNYTWWDLVTGARARNVGWRIDYFFASRNLKDKIKKAYILPEVTGSDHCPIGLEVS